MRFFQNIAAIIILLSATAFPDVIHLRSGGRIEGEIVSQGEDSVRVKSKAGEMSISRDRIERIEHKKLPLEEYKETLETLKEDDVLGHYALGVWCKEHRLRKQARERFRYVLKLSPNHKGARRKLGYERFRGRWMTRGEIRQARGLVKVDGKWVTPEEAEKLKKAGEQKQIARRIARLAHAIELGSPANQKRAMTRFEAMKDPNATGPLGRFADHRIPEVRKGVIAALSNIRTIEAADELARVAILDPEQSLRKLAVQGMMKIKDVDPSSHFISALRTWTKKPVNTKQDAVMKRRVLSRSAWALGEIGDRKAVPALISTLVVDMGYYVTKQSTRTVTGPSTVRAPQIGPDGKPTGRVLSGRTIRGGFGGTTTEKERVIFTNEEALNALRKITGQSFGLDQNKWREWWLLNQPVFKAESPFDE